MHDLAGLTDPPADFRGVVRVFPLPNLVMFPYAVQPLHVFEPRYRELFEDALDGDRLIVLVGLAPGWERDYEGRPPWLRVGCLTRILSHSRDDEGRYNALLAGVRRVELRRELPPLRKFRQAEAAILEDQYPPHGAAERSRWQRALLDEFRRRLPKEPAIAEQVEQLLSSPLPLGKLADIMAHTLPLPQDVRQALLEELDVDRRAEQLRQALQREPGPGDGGFPPSFSEN